MAENQNAIIVKNVHKTFKLPHEQHSGIKQRIVNVFNFQRGYEVQNALSDVSFEIKEGEFFGIVGRNGSGKSTLLKLIAGIYVPDKGAVQVNGSLTPFIELGVGFNPELTGRENVFLNGALLGFDRNQMEAMYKDIVGFAEIEKFMDQKLKNYSSGMQVRLAFSIAIRAKTDVLLLDEVLAVGDEAFQRKCFAYFASLKKDKKTVVLVTHAMSTVEKYCDRALFLNEGKTIDIGDPRKIAGEYSNENSSNYFKAKENTEKRNINKITEQQEKELGIEYKLLDNNGLECRIFKPQDTIHLEVKWKSDSIKNIGVALLKESGECIFGTNTVIDNVKINNKKIIYTVKLSITEGDYKFIIAFLGKNAKDQIYFAEHGLYFGVGKDEEGWVGIAKLESSWTNKEK